MERLNRKDYTDETILQEAFAIIPEERREKLLPIFTDWLNGDSIQSLAEKYDITQPLASKRIHRMAYTYQRVIYRINHPVILEEFNAMRCLEEVTCVRDANMVTKALDIQDIRELSKFTKTEFLEKINNNRISRRGLTRSKPEDIFNMMEKMGIHFKEA